MAVKTQKLPVAAVRRIVIVVVILVVDGQLAQPGAGELTPAARADPGIELERLLTVGLLTLGLVPPLFGDCPVELRRLLHYFPSSARDADIVPPNSCNARDALS